MTTSDAAPLTRWVPDLSTFAARLAVVRNHMQWNAKEAAIACGFPAQSWRNWEQGNRPRDYAGVCEAISRRTGVPTTWLAFGPESPLTDGTTKTAFWTPSLGVSDELVAV